MNAYKRLLQLVCLTLSLMSWTLAIGQEGKKPEPRIEPPIATLSQQGLERITKDKMATRSDKLEAYALLAARAQAAREDEKAQDYAKRALKIWSFLERQEKADDKLRQRDCDSAARAVFTQAELERGHIKEIKLTSKSLNKDLTRKVSAMGIAKNSYSKSMGLGQKCNIPEWMVASMVRTGELFEDMIQDIKTSPTPEGIGELYRASLDDYYKPMLEQAQRHYQAAQKIESRGDAATIGWQKRAEERLQEVQVQLCALKFEKCPESGTTSH